MPTSHAEFGIHTTGDDVVSSFPTQVEGKVILITGANPGGIGGATAVSLAKANPKILIIAGRNKEKLAAMTDSIRKVNTSVVTKQLLLDLSSQQSCRRAAQEVLDDSDITQIDMLINNAGVMSIAERTLAPEGIEMQFATNHVGHFLFTNLVMPKIIVAAQSSAPGSTRIINLSSRAVEFGPVRFSDWNFTLKEEQLPSSEHMSQPVRQMWNRLEDLPYVPEAAYGQSKSANVLFTVELNSRLRNKYGIFSAAVHPGAVESELVRHVGTEQTEQLEAQIRKVYPNYTKKNIGEGCSTTLVAALDPELAIGDLLFDDCQVATWCPDWASSAEKAQNLWCLTEGLVRQQFRC